MSVTVFQDNGGVCLTICDANGLDAVDRVAVLLEGLYSTLDAVVYRGNNLLGVVLMPSRLRVDLREFLLTVNLMSPS